MKQLLRDVANGTLFTAFGKKFVRLDELDGGIFVIAADAWGIMRFCSDGNSKHHNDLRESGILAYLNECLENLKATGAFDYNFKSFRIDLEDDSGKSDYRSLKTRIGLMTLRQYEKYWKIIPNIDTPWWLATPYGATDNSPNEHDTSYVWRVGTSGNRGYYNCINAYGVRPTMVLDPVFYVDVNEDEPETPPTQPESPTTPSEPEEIKEENPLEVYELDDLLNEIKRRAEKKG